MLGMLLAYDAAGEIVATLDWLVALDDVGNPVGLVDFTAHEQAGGEHTTMWRPSRAAGSKVWPEWLGGRIYEFRVELAGPPGRKRLVALVHKTSGHRRERAAIESAIAERTDGDLRTIVGGPDRPLPLDDEGRTAPRPKYERPLLPLVNLPRS